MYCHNSVNVFSVKLFGKRLYLVCIANLQLVVMNLPCVIFTWAMWFLFVV